LTVSRPGKKEKAVDLPTTHGLGSNAQAKAGKTKRPWAEEASPTASFASLV
jgi:hypothetical protein